MYLNNHSEYSSKAVFFCAMIMKLFLLGVAAFSALLLGQCYGDLPNLNSEDLQVDEFEEGMHVI